MGERTRYKQIALNIMRIADKFNKKSFGIDTKGFKYIKLADIYNGELPDEKHRIDGIYIHPSKLGESGVLVDVSNKWLVNVPSHLNETLKAILADADAVEAIISGHFGYTIYPYESRLKTCYSVHFIDL